MKKFKDLREAKTDVSVEQGVKKFMEIANRAGLAYYKKHYPQLALSLDWKLVAKKGSKYYKVIEYKHNQSGGSVHCFIDSTNGDVLKAAGWSKPANGARGNVTDTEYMKKLPSIFDPHSGYLYK